MDDGSSPLGAFAVFLLFIIINGGLYGFGSAIQRVTENDVEKNPPRKEKMARWLLEVVNHPHKVVNTILTAGTLMSILAGYLGIRGFVLPLYRMLHQLPVLAGIPDRIMFLLCGILIISLFLILLVSVGVISAKKIFSYHPVEWVYRTAPFVHFIVVLFTPFTFLIIKISNLIVRLFGVDPHHNEVDVTEEEIISMVDDAHEQGVIEENEAEMIQNIMEFSDKEAQDIMTHRKNIHAIDVDTLLKDALTDMLNGSNSRYPVYQEDFDDIVGILHLKDVMKQMTFQHNGELPVGKIPGLVRDASYIPETRSINDLFKRMQAKKIHMAVVVDEYGQTSGIVTMEDILEEIVGNILDEYDVEDAFITSLLDDSYLMKGLTPLDEVGETLGLDFDEEDYDTLNGYLTSILGHIPNIQEDKEVKACGYLFTLLSVENNTIQKVRVDKLPLEEGKGETQCQDIQNSLT